MIGSNAVIKNTHAVIKTSVLSSDAPDASRYPHDDAQWVIEKMTLHADHCVDNQGKRDIFICPYFFKAFLYLNRSAQCN